jgi:hypothetical protein
LDRHTQRRGGEGDPRRAAIKRGADARPGDNRVASYAPWLRLFPAFLTSSDLYLTGFPDGHLADYDKAVEARAPGRAVWASDFSSP